MQGTIRHEPRWIPTARSKLGVREVFGTAPGQDNPEILAFLAVTHLPPDLKLHDETAWCSAYACWVLEQCGIRSTRSAAAASWLSWGIHLTEPLIGCIAVVARRDPNNPGAAHVGFVVGWEADTLLLLAGNQGNRVSIKAWPKSAVKPNGYRWPAGEP